jgi:ribonuclease HI
MGKDTESTVYAAELKGIHLALQILIANPDPHQKRATISTDNQSAPKIIRTPRDTLGQYILRNTLQLLEDVIHREVKVELRWIPAHRGISVNEAADSAAKEAARISSRTTLTTPGGNPRQERNGDGAAAEGRITLLMTAKRTINQALHKDWETIWSRGQHGRYLHSLGAKPDKKTLRMHQHLPRAISSIITQIRINKTDVGFCQVATEGTDLLPKQTENLGAATRGEK